MIQSQLGFSGIQPLVIQVYVNTVCPSDEALKLQGFKNVLLSQFDTCVPFY